MTAHPPQPASRLPRVGEGRFCDFSRNPPRLHKPLSPTPQLSDYISCETTPTLRTHQTYVSRETSHPALRRPQQPAAFHVKHGEPSSNIEEHNPDFPRLPSHSTNSLGNRRTRNWMADLKSIQRLFVCAPPVPRNKPYGFQRICGIRANAFYKAQLQMQRILSTKMPMFHVKHLSLFKAVCGDDYVDG